MMHDRIQKISGRICHVVSDNVCAESVIIKPLCEFERRLLVNECQRITELSSVGFTMYAFEIEDNELRSHAGFEKIFEYVTQELMPAIREEYPYKHYILGGYSLGGLFALWASTKTNLFDSIASCSPSLWIEGWDDYADCNPVKAKYVYLSLGDKEANTKKGNFACINDRINLQHKRHINLLGEHNCCLEINEGGHFKDIELRKAKGFAWCLNK